jgi:spermidine synthase
MLDRRLQKPLFLLFFTSGFCGLLYQVVWVRMAFASFGVITPILSVVVSVFMFGLFVGSWGAGKAVGPLTARTGLSAAWLYAAAELVIAVGAFAVPRLLRGGEVLLLRAGEADSLRYLTWSGLILGGAIFPWCVAMGATFPLMMAFVKEQDTGETTSFSFLYLANVIGAMAGTLVTALIFVEALGFSRTLAVAAALNVAIATAAGSLALRFPRRVRADSDAAPASPTPAARALSGTEARFATLVLFTTGFTSMGMEVTWTRAFTSVLGTQVYSFASLLFCYLLATWVGSLKYRRDLARGRVASTPSLLAWLAPAALLPIVANDPRVFAWLFDVIGDDPSDVLGVATVLASILPFCGILGYLTPKLIDGYAEGRPDGAGFSYAVNVLGCILGPVVVSYAVLPALGVKATLLVLAVPYALLLARRAREAATAPRRGLALAALAIVALGSFASRTYEDQPRGFSGRPGLVLRDHTATVIAYGDGMEKRLLVNGVGITHLSTITKMMAHLPLGLVRAPRSALVICFGMGTTYRSLMSWGVHATAVELVPSVKEAFPYFFADAGDLVRRPNGQVVVDDGRRFLQRTGESFDVITLDPPPPVEAAASSLLYSEEFYASAKARLRPGGILQQWLPTAEPSTIAAVARSLLRSFPHVRVFRSYEGWGHHFLASMEPISIPDAGALVARLPPAAKADLAEWVPSRDPAEPVALVLKREVDPRDLVREGEARITDDRPYNEYYLVRRAWRLARKLTGHAEEEPVARPAPAGTAAR